MSPTQHDIRGDVVGRYTVLEVTVLASPSLVSLVSGVWVFSWPRTLLVWFACGLGVLVLAVVSGRTSAIRYSLLEWPQSETKADIAASTIAYNGVLALGIVLGQIAWSVSNNRLLATSIGALLPLWFLKHLRLLVFLEE